MTSVSTQLQNDACVALGVTDISAIGAPGGQKVVRLVTDGTQQFVLKVVALRTSAPESLIRAEREVELLRAISNVHVVSVVSDLAVLGSPPAGAAWLEELLDGDDLDAYLGTPWSWDETATLALEVGKGLQSAHEQGVIHRDLSPRNVRRQANGTYKVMDFGFARHTLRTGITLMGQPGTRGYLSPEHLNSYSGGPIAASDVFCVGILMYQALTGQPPIAWNGDDADYMTRLSRVEYQPTTAARPDLNAAQLSIVERCLHPQPARRYRRAERLVEALEAL